MANKGSCWWIIIDSFGNEFKRLKGRQKARFNSHASILKTDKISYKIGYRISGDTFRLLYLPRRKMDLLDRSKKINKNLLCNGKPILQIQGQSCKLVWTEIINIRS